MIFLSFVQSVDVPYLECKTRKMMGKDFVVSNFVLKISHLANMNPEFILPNCPIYIFSGVGGMHAVSRSIQLPH